MRRFLIAGNWKMNKTSLETRSFFEQLKPLLEPKLTSELLICPPFTALTEAFHANNGQIALGAQNVYPQTSGAYTGEIAPAMLNEWVSYVIVGHSERRTLLQESDAFINEKIHALLQAHLKPILCVGESLEERKQDRAFEVIANELKAGLEGVSASSMLNVTIAYEPIWAIGTGETATPEIAQSVHAFIRNCLQEKFDATTAAKVRILYGGSLKSSNAKELLSQPDIDGGLIGGASLKPEDFMAIARIADTISK
jgi:triosephosphate isomerase